MTLPSRLWRVGRRKERVLATGGIIHAFSPRPGLTPRQNYRRDRLLWMVRDPLLSLIPHRCRSHRWVRSYFWQEAEVERITARAKQLSRDLGWDR